MSLQVNSLSVRVRALWLLGQCASSVVWQGGSADSLYPRWPTSPPCSHFAQTQSDPWPPRTLRLAPGSSVTQRVCFLSLPVTPFSAQHFPQEKLPSQCFRRWCAPHPAPHPSQPCPLVPQGFRSQADPGSRGGSSS